MDQQGKDSDQNNDDLSCNWEDKYKQLQQKLNSFEHEHKKIEIQIKSDLEFQRKRAKEFEQKYKTAIKYKNQEEELKKILSELSEKLTTKQNQILQYIKAQQQKKRKIAELTDQNEELTKSGEEFKQMIEQMKEGVISAIHQKDTIISDLEQKLIEFENIDIKKLQNMIVQLGQKNQELEDKAETERHEIEALVEIKQEELKEIKDKFDMQRERYEQKISLLQRDIISYEKHIQKVNEERSNEEDLEQNYYLLEEKLRKTEKKLNEAEQSHKNDKANLFEAIQKLENELTSRSDQTEEIKSYANKIKELQKEVKNRKKEVQDSKSVIEKTKTDYLKKITQLEQEKKKIQDNLQIKSSELERARNEVEETKAEVKIPQKQPQPVIQNDRSSLAVELENTPKAVNKRDSSQESVAVIQKLKAQIKSLQQNIDELNTRLAEETKQIQVLRERLVTMSGSGGRSDSEAQLLVQIQDLNSYIKKVQHILMNTKLKKAEDESYWSLREAELKKQVDKIDKKCKKEKAELLERIDRMKKSNVKDKKSDYYQSSLK